MAFLNLRRFVGYFLFLQNSMKAGSQQMNTIMDTNVKQFNSQNIDSNRHVTHYEYS